MLNDIILFLSIFCIGIGIAGIIICGMKFYFYMIEDERRYQRTRIILREMNNGKDINEAAKIADDFDDNYRKVYKWFYGKD